MSTMTHCDKVLSVLADGKGHSTSDLYRRAGNMILHSRIADLRRRGHNIVCERIKGLKGPEAYVYTWLDAPEQPSMPTPIPDEASRKEREYIQRYDERQRYRPFMVIGGEVVQIAGAGCKHEVGIIPMLNTLYTDGEYDGLNQVGVLDTHNWRLGKSGSWKINPFVID